MRRYHILIGPAATAVLTTRTHALACHGAAALSTAEPPGEAQIFRLPIPPALHLIGMELALCRLKEHRIEDGWDRNRHPLLPGDRSRTSLVVRVALPRHALALAVIERADICRIPQNNRDG
jgi:hypothetical protein